MSLSRRRTLQVLTLASVAALSGCSALQRRDPPRINIAGIDPIAGQGMEWRLALKLRVQNPNDSEITYDGIALDLSVDGKTFASGVSDERGTIPRFGETVLTVPVSVSAFSALRQAWGFASSGNLQRLPYVLRGKLSGGTFGTTRFSDQGTLSLPGFE